MSFAFAVKIAISKCISKLVRHFAVQILLIMRHPVFLTNYPLIFTEQLHQHQVMMPRSILKSRRSEESLSPLSDDCVPVISGSGGNAALTGSCDDFRSDEKSADFRFDNQKNSSNNSSSNIRPSILKQRDSSRDEGYHSSKLRDKSRSPSRGATCSPPENINEVVFSGKKLLK